MIARICVVTLLAACGSSTPQQQPAFDARFSDGGFPPSDGALGLDGFGFPDASPTPDGSSLPPIDATVAPITDPLHGLPTGVAQWQVMCGRGYGDAISAAFCSGTAPPPLGSITDVEALLGLVPGTAGVAISFTSETTGLEMRNVTSLSPRAFVMTAPNANGSPNARFAVLSFVRGEPFVEMVANDPTTGTLRFFLLRFTLACEPSCNFADMLTPSIESGWTGYSIYDEHSIADTTLDCLACHQPDGPSNVKVLRMQEMTQPWDHWFYDAHPSGHALIDDYMAAHGAESYAGVPAVLIRPSTPQPLEDLVTNNGFGAQPDAFDSTKIEGELAATGTSPTWNGLYAASVAGTDIPAPYFGVPQTDATLTAQMTTAYKQTIAGTLPRDQMPDIRQTIRSDALAQLSIRPAAGLDAAGILHHMCRTCHNPQLDPSLSRSYFDVDTLSQLSSYEKDLAIARLQKTDYQQMPPARFHELSPDEIAKVIAALQ